MQYDKDFKLQALELSDDIGTKKASEQLGIPYNTLSEWRSIRKRFGIDSFVGSGHTIQPAQSLSDKDLRIKQLEAELRATQRANEILKEALGFFASSRKK